MKFAILIGLGAMFFAGCSGDLVDNPTALSKGGTVQNGSPSPTTPPSTGTTPPGSGGSTTGSGSSNDPNNAVLMIMPNTGCASSGVPFNSSSSPIVANVGSNLTVINASGVPQYFHTTGASKTLGPFPHPGMAIANGATAKIAITAPYNFSTDPMVYCHSDGNTAERLYINAVVPSN
jgi:hypothetical protein